MVVIPLLLFEKTQASSPIPPAELAVASMEKVATALRSETRSTSRLPAVFSLSWNAIWPLSILDKGQVPRAAEGFLYRLSPDRNERVAGHRPPLILEAYRNGFPTYGLRLDGTIDAARPLGFVYSNRGECVNVSVSVFDGAVWSKPKMTIREKTLLGKMLASNYFSSIDPPLVGTNEFGAVWIQIIAKGYGTYWIDKKLNCLGPFGTNCQLVPESESVIRDLVSGHYSDALKKKT